MGVIKIEIKVTDKDVSGWNRYQQMWTGIKLTNQQMVDIIKESPDGGDRFLQEAVEVEFETGMRETFMGMLSKKLIGEDWPTYSSFGSGLTNAATADTHDASMEAFMKKLYEAAEKAGFKVQKETDDEK
jgi:hypothetical protein